MIRIKDIADRAGVSPTTVSNVIHGKTGRVSKATVEKINRILKEMEYVPSISARMLANNSSGLIGVALGFMKKGNASSFEDPFVSAMLGNLEYQIREHGYYMMLVARHEQDDIMQQALGWNFDGMIAMALKEKEIAELSERLGKPLVTIDQYLPPELGVRSITMDDRGGAYQMSQYLIGKGHKLRTLKAAILGSRGIQSRGRRHMRRCFRSSKNRQRSFFHRITMHLKHPTFCRTGE